MDRREFIAGGVAAGTAIALGTQTAIAQGRNRNQAKFRMKYAPHFGMFRNNAGSDPIDQLKFAADQGFTAWEDNGMMQKSTDLQSKIAKTMEQIEMMMGVFVSSGGFERNEFTTSTSKDLHDRLRAQMRKAVGLHLCRAISARNLNVITRWPTVLKTSKYAPMYANRQG